MKPIEQQINKDLILREKLALQRTVLANQTTLLSFLRTSLYFLVAGLSLQNLLLLKNGLVFQLTFFVISLGTFVFGLINYFRHRRIIRDSERHIGDYKADYLNKPS
jgi:putative membrane protein